MVVDPATPGEIVQWSGVFFITAVDRGSVVTHKAAVAVKRTVWMSTAFGDAHPELYDLVVLASGLPLSKWHVLSGTIDEYAACKIKAKQILASVMEDEVHMEEPFVLCNNV